MPPRPRGGPPLPVAPPRGEGPGVAVAELVDPAAQPLKLDLAAGRAGLEHRVHLPRVQRPGLALTGYTDYIRYGRVQIVGSSEVGYLRKLPPRRRTAILAKLCRCRITCFVVTKGLVPPTELLSAAEARGIPVLTTPLESTAFIKILSVFLEERLATRLHLHSVLLDVFGLGVLILGESGIGKSECALELIDRGHRLVADDVVEIKRMGDVLVGVSPDLTRFHMELRGLGVLNIKDLYGVSSMRLSKKVELVIQLERWEAGKEYDRLGLRDETFLILGVEVPLVRMPVAPGRNIALLVEVAGAQPAAARGRLRRGQAIRGAGGRAGRLAGEAAPGGTEAAVSAARRQPPRLLVITGLSGSGKTHVSRALEDAGWFCVDNLPTALVPSFADLIGRSPELRRSALVVDVRERGFPESFPAVYRELKRRRGLAPSLVFLEADEKTLLRRFSETRRPHPLAGPEPAIEGIRAERAALGPVRKMADVILDTSRFTVHQLRDYVRERYDVRAEGRRMAVSVLSFGYKHGVPPEADIVFDARFLPNPNFVPRLRRLSGADAAVVAYLRRQPETAAFLTRVLSLVRFVLPRHEREGRSYLTIALGCTGGRHRSVMLANAVGAAVRKKGLPVRVYHRDLKLG